MADVLKMPSKPAQRRYGALQLALRGFQTQEAGNKLIAALEELGFEVMDSFDGQSDSEGGLIETYITPCASLETDDIEEIKERIYRQCSDLDVYIQWTGWDQTGESDV